MKKLMDTIKMEYDTAYLSIAAMKEKAIRHTRKISVAMALLNVSLIMGSTVTAGAVGATAITDKIKEILSSLYGQLLGLTTIIAAVALIVALLGYFTGKDDRAVSVSKEWIKKIIYAWCAINGLGLLFAVLGAFFNSSTQLLL